MKKLKILNYKTNPDNGLLNKLTKRYSTVSVKFIRKTPRGKTPQTISAGSYDMNGHNSEDHRREIGAPILISKTTIDADRTDITEQPLRHSPSSESENESFYMDAISAVPPVQDIKFQFFSHSDIPATVNERLNVSDTLILPKMKDKDTELIPPMKKARSKSTQNLHKSELKVYLEKTTSLELEQNLYIANLEHCYDTPKKHKSNSTETLKNANITSNSYSEPNTPSSPQKAEPRRNSVNSLNKSRSSLKRENNGTIDGSLEDFDLKSASFQSLDAKNLFLSIEELNEITRQINESEDFNHEIDLEYCEHRDNLKPNERRITLLKNKNASLINFNRRRERINNAWSGLKNWIGEEGEKFKEVVQKHAAMQRVGALTQVEGRPTKKSMKSSDISKRFVGDYSNASSMMSVAQPTFGQTAIDTDDSDGCLQSDTESTFRNNSQNISRSRIASNEQLLEGQNGFEELRRYVKQGSDFGKDLVAILQERVDSEQLYAKSLSKMASKLNKACREIPGSIADAWRGVATEMENRSEVHRQFSSSLVDEIVKPLKTIIENQHKSRKTIESSVDKSARILSEWRISEAKSKKVSHTAARENEKLQDAMLDVRIQRSPSIALLHHGTIGNKNGAEKELKNAEKDCAKLDNKRRKAEETVKRADVEYYTLCIRAERARVEWEMSVLRGSTVLQNLENQRLVNMKNYVSAYLRLTSEMNPALESLVVRLAPQIEACNVQKDLTVIKNIRRASEGPSEQLLPDFYCEHTTLAMNRERRKHALVKLLQLVRSDLERERRSRNGLKGITNSLNAHDNQSITDKLYHIRSMLTYLEGARFKLQSALLELDHKPRSSHPLASHIQITRDRTGLQQSILKVPLWLKNDDKLNGDCKDIEYDIEFQTNGSCIDIKNETLIKNFGNNLNRSKSTSEILHNDEIHKVTTNGKIRTLPTNDTDSPDFDRGVADGGSNQPDSDFDEFSSQDDEDEIRREKLDEQTKQRKSNNTTHKSVVISRCKALYSYTPKLYDELELTPGDIIEVHAKQEDGWWLGALNNHVGIFPATYVEEII